MKKIKLISIAALIQFSALAAYADPASDATTGYLRATEQVQALRAAGKLDDASFLAVQTIGKIRDEIGIDQVVRRIQTRMIQTRNEVKTEHHDSYHFLAGTFSGLLGLLSGAGQAESSSYDDVTRLITQNPEEIAEFPALEIRERQALRQQLVRYIGDHTVDLSVLKVLAATYFQMLVEKSGQGGGVDIGEFDQVLQASQGFHFLGEQEVTVCVETNYIDSSKQKNGRSGLNLNLLFFGVNFSEKWEKNDEKFAHQETECKSSVNVVQSSSQDVVWNVNLTRLDRVVQSWARAAVLKVTLSPGNDLPFPTFGSPYFRN